jgi:hypothetical protein
MGTGILRIDGAICGECGIVYNFDVVQRLYPGDTLAAVCPNDHTDSWTAQQLERGSHHTGKASTRAFKSEREN